MHEHERYRTSPGVKLNIVSQERIFIIVHELTLLAEICGEL